MSMDLKDGHSSLRVFQPCDLLNRGWGCAAFTVDCASVSLAVQPASLGMLLCPVVTCVLVWDMRVESTC